MTHKSDKLTPLTEQDREILQAIRSIKYGSILVVIHNAEILQIEMTNKRRFSSAKTASSQL